MTQWGEPATKALAMKKEGIRTIGLGLLSEPGRARAEGVPGELGGQRCTMI